MNPEQQRRYQITKHELKKFEEALAVIEETGQTIYPEKIWIAQCAALRSMINDLREQMADLEKAVE